MGAVQIKVKNGIKNYHKRVVNIPGVQTTARWAIHLSYIVSFNSHTGLVKLVLLLT